LALGSSAKEITVARNEDGLLEVFYIGVDDVIYHNDQKSTGWNGEIPLPGGVSTTLPYGGPPFQITVGQNQRRTRTGGHRIKSDRRLQFSVPRAVCSTSR
jgi:hypothetical protein